MPRVLVCRSLGVSLFVSLLVASSSAQQQMASLHPQTAITWQRTSPTLGRPEGPVLYQIIFRSSATPGNVPVISPQFTLMNSPITVGGGNVAIGGLSVNGATGIVSFAGGQTFPSSAGVSSVTAGNSFITIGGTGSNPNVSFNTVNGDARYLTLTGGTMTGNITFAAGQTFPGLSSLAGEVTGPANNTVVTNAVSGNTKNAIVRRDASGNFSAGTVTLSNTLALPSTTSATSGVITLNGSVFLHNFGSFNTFLGFGAGNLIASGNSNTGVGLGTLQNNTGNSNNAFGVGALQTNTSGVQNVAVGVSALSANSSGSGNTAIGVNALTSMSPGGSGNIAIGKDAGRFLIGTDSNNIDIGNTGMGGESNTIRIGTSQTATFIAGSVSLPSIASGQVVKSLNGLFDNITLAAGAGLSLTPSGQTLTLANTGQLLPAWNLAGNSGTGCSTSPCGVFLGSTDNDPIEFRVNNQRALRIEPQIDSGDSNSPAPNIIGGYSGNSVTGGAVGATIAGGGEQGKVNIVGSSFGTVGGGYSNTASGSGSSTVAGGGSNSASGAQSTVAGGFANLASALDSTVAGGAFNTASGGGSTVAGGLFDTASGAGSFAAGQYTTDNNGTKSFNGVFLWGDNNAGSAYLIASADNQFLARAAGGVKFFTSSNYTTGVTLAAGGGSWASVSDRNVKANFTAIRPQEVLARLVAMPITTWNYKTERASIHHIGPMAQDFYAAFNVGEDNKHITEIDEAGVAFAAIQGLNQKLEQQVKMLRAEARKKDAQISARQDQITSQREQLAALRGQVASIVSGKDAKIAALQQQMEAVMLRLTAVEKAKSVQPGTQLASAR